MSTFTKLRLRRLNDVGCRLSSPALGGCRRELDAGHLGGDARAGRAGNHRADVGQGADHRVVAGRAAKSHAAMIFGSIDPAANSDRYWSSSASGFARAIAR